MKNKNHDKGVWTIFKSGLQPVQKMPYLSDQEEWPR